MYICFKCVLLLLPWQKLKRIFLLSKKKYLTTWRFFILVIARSTCRAQRASETFSVGFSYIRHYMACEMTCSSILNLHSSLFRSLPIAILQQVIRTQKQRTPEVRAVLNKSAGNEKALVSDWLSCQLPLARLFISTSMTPRTTTWKQRLIYHATPFRPISYVMWIWLCDMDILSCPFWICQVLNDRW